MAVANGNRKWSGSETLWRQFTAIDLATVAYIAVATGAVLLSFRGEGIPGWPWVLTAHGLIVVLVLLAPRARRSGRVGRFIGDWYPMLLLPALYGEIGVLTLSAGFQNDQLIQRLETWVFGSQISYRWIRESPNATLSFILHSCYLAYYPILYASPFALWIVGRRDASRHTIFGIMATFYLCYVVFLFFPVAGPRYAFDGAHNVATQGWPARVAAWLPRPRARARRSTARTTWRRRFGRPGLRPGSSTAATRGAPRSRRHTSPRRSSRPAWRSGIGPRWDSWCCRSRQV